MEVNNNRLLVEDDDELLVVVVVVVVARIEKCPTVVDALLCVRYTN